MKRHRRYFRAEHKAEVVRAHFFDKVSVHDLCQTQQILPSVFYMWCRKLFSGAGKVFSRANTSRTINSLRRQISLWEHNRDLETIRLGDLDREAIALVPGIHAIRRQHAKGITA